MCMYFFVYICVCKYFCLCMCLCICVCVCLCASMCVCVMYVLVHVYAFVGVYISGNAFVGICSMAVCVVTCAWVWATLPFLVVSHLWHNDFRKISPVHHTYF